MRVGADLSVSELARRYEAGDSLRDIGAACGLSYQTVRRHLRQAGVSMRGRHESPKRKRLQGEAKLLYGLGLSMGAVGAALGVHRVTVRRLLVGAEVKIRPPGVQPGGRSRGGPLCVTTRGYSLTGDRTGQPTLVHRACWETHHGPIPTGHLVHHINGDRLDNRVENLACMSRGAHATLHNHKR